MAQHVQPMARTSTSSNAAYCTERGQLGTGEYYWAEVIRNDYERMPGGISARRRVPAFSVSVHQNMRGQVTEFTYEPKTKPARGLLAARTLTGLVRVHLAGLDRGES